MFRDLLSSNLWIWNMDITHVIAAVLLFNTLWVTQGFTYLHSIIQYTIVYIFLGLVITFEQLHLGDFFKFIKQWSPERR